MMERKKRKLQDDDVAFSDNWLTEKTLRGLSRQLASGWETLATYLDISSATVGKLKRDHKGTEEQIFQMFLLFKGQNRQDHRDQLLVALHKIGRNDIVQELKRETEQPEGKDTENAQENEGKLSSLIQLISY